MQLPFLLVEVMLLCLGGGLLTGVGADEAGAEHRAFLHVSRRLDDLAFLAPLVCAVIKESAVDAGSLVGFFVVLFPVSVLVR